MQNMGKITCLCGLLGYPCQGTTLDCQVNRQNSEKRRKGTDKRRIDNKTGQTTYPAPHVDSRPISGLPEDILEFRDLALSDRWKQTTFVGTEIMRWETNEMYYTDALAWYWDLIMHSSDALVAYDFEAYEFYEEWRKAIKGGMLNA